MQTQRTQYTLKRDTMLSCVGMKHMHLMIKAAGQYSRPDENTNFTQSKLRATN